MSLSGYRLRQLAGVLERKADHHQDGLAELSAQRVGRLFLLPFFENTNQLVKKKVLCEPDTAELFGVNDLKLDKITIVKLYKFSRNPTYVELLTWACENRKVPIRIVHLYGIAKDCGFEMRFCEEPGIQAIIALGDVKDKSVPCLLDEEMWFSLSSDPIDGPWNCDVVLFGFIDVFDDTQNT